MVGIKLLKEIIFCLKYQTDVNVNDEVRKAVEYLNEQGIECKILYPDEEVQTKERLLLGVIGNGEETALSDILFLTDSGLFSDYLTTSGAFVVGILHKANTGEDFGGIKYVFSDIEEVELDSYVKAYQRYAGLPWKILETRRCIIRETTVDDVDAFYELYSDPEMTRYMEGLFEDSEDEKKYTEDYINKVYSLLGFGVWTVVQKETGDIIGRAGYSIRNGFDDVELGFLIGLDYQRQGYAYEVCSAILVYGRNILGFNKVLAFVKEGNRSSIRLCEKLGFSEAGTVQIEENIYGEEYNDGERVAPSQAKYGKYMKMSVDFT